MKYDEFKRQLGKAGLSVKSFADLIKQNPNSITNYAAQGEVPPHLAIISALMGYMADNGLDYRVGLEKVQFEACKPRGSSIKGKFGSIKTRVLAQEREINVIDQKTDYLFRNDDYRVDDLTNKQQKTFKVISMFSGCGGMDLGFIGGFEFLGKSYNENSFEIIWANDLNEAACRSYTNNIGRHIHQGDIWKLIDEMPKEADVIIGGFPCQDISVNGKGAGIDGKRSGLYRAMVEAVSRIRPKIFVAENVKGLLMKHNAKSFERVMTDFKYLGYDVTFNLYHAADFGVPQTRERVIIVGTLPNVAHFIPPIPSHRKDQYITARAAIGDLEMLPENTAFNHIWSRANKSAEQGNRRLIADRPGYTIRAECHGNIQFHYELPRRISMREAARFQSFPDNYIFDAKLRETERQIGNAVPPVLAWHIAQAVQQTLFENS